jgi:hypothetical protein
MSMRMFVGMRRKYHYRPGVFDEIPDRGPWRIWWGDEITPRRRKAEAAARELARQRGGVPVIGYWDQVWNAVRVDVVREES